MTKSKLKKVASTSKKKVSKAVKKPVKTAKKTTKVAAKAANSAKREVVKAVAPRQCSTGLCKITTFVLGMVVGALLFLFLSSFSQSDYGQTSTFSDRFNLFRWNSVQEVQVKNLNPTLNLRPDLDGNFNVRPDLDGN